MGQRTSITVSIAVPTASATRPTTLMASRLWLTTDSTVGICQQPQSQISETDERAPLSNRDHGSLQHTVLLELEALPDTSNSAGSSASSCDALVCRVEMSSPKPQDGSCGQRSTPAQTCGKVTETSFFLRSRAQMSGAPCLQTQPSR